MVLLSIGIIGQKRETLPKILGFSHGSDQAQIVFLVPIHFRACADSLNFCVDAEFNSLSNDIIFNRSHRPKNKDFTQNTGVDR